MSKKVRRRSPPARELRDRKYRARTERDRTKYHRPDGRRWLTDGDPKSGAE